MDGLQLGIKLNKSPGPKKFVKTLTPLQKRLNAIKLATKAQDSNSESDWDTDDDNKENY